MAKNKDRRTSSLKEDLENLARGLTADITKLHKRVHSLEQKIGSTNVEATLTSDAERITTLEDWRLSLVGLE